MSRIRTVKPEFHKHEELSALPEATHLLAAALLNYADDEGYFNANPGLVKAECCPLREPSVTIPVSLQSLSNIGWLQLGTGADGKRYGRVVTFAEHQVISHPKTSKIKAVGITWDASEPLPVIVQEASVLNGIEGKGIEQGMEGKGNPAPGGAPPIEPQAQATDEGDDPFDVPLLLDRSDVAEAVRRWNVMAERIGLPTAQKLTAARKKLMLARLRDVAGLPGWDAALGKVEGSRFLRGEANGSGHENFKVTLDWVLKEGNFVKLMEGNYDDRPGLGRGAMAAAFDKLYAEAEADAR